MKSDQDYRRWKQRKPKNFEHEGPVERGSKFDHSRASMSHYSWHCGSRIGVDTQERDVYSKTLLIELHVEDKLKDALLQWSREHIGSPICKSKVA
jgi:hypothetical protein